MCIVWVSEWVLWECDLIIDGVSRELWVESTQRVKNFSWCRVDFTVRFNNCEPLSSLNYLLPIEIPSIFSFHTVLFTTFYFHFHFLKKINKNKNFRILCLWLFGEKSRFMINWLNLERIFNFQLYWLTQWVLTDSGKVWDLGTTITPWIPHSHSREEED